VATEMDFARDEHARHSAAEIFRDLVAVAERALNAFGQISQRLLVQISPATSRAPPSRRSMIASSVIGIYYLWRA
ncbi:MAG: hypothetical protein ACJ8AJ_13795, partial [Gemmatimonadaceae bacterium]